MDERRLEQLLRQGPPFATAYVSRPLPVDEGVAVHHRLTRRRLAVALLTTALLLAATLAALLVFGSLRATHPGPIVIIRSNVISLHPTDGSPEREIVHAVPDRHGDWCPEATVAGWGSCGLFQHLAVTPDGRRLVMSVSRIQLAGDASDSNDLFELNVDGSGLRLVHHEDTAEFDFALAPDGHHVAYTAGAPQANGTRMGCLDLDSGEDTLCAMAAAR